MPFDTTLAVPTTATVRATGAPTTALRARRRAMGMSVLLFVFVVSFQGGDDRLHRNASTGDELSSGVAQRRGERRRPGVLPDEDCANGSWLDNFGHGGDVGLRQQRGD